MVHEGQARDPRGGSGGGKSRAGKDRGPAVLTDNRETGDNVEVSEHRNAARGWLIWAVLALAIAACWTGWRMTRPRSEVVAGERAGIAPHILKPLLRDEQLYQTARSLTAFASTPAEQPLAQQAQHLADEVMDASFTIAMVEAAQNAPASADHADEVRVAHAKAAVATDQAWIERLKAHAVPRQVLARLPAAMDVAQAQLGLDQARLHDAKTDLVRNGGGGLERIQQLQQEHEAIHAGDHAAGVAAASPGGRGLVGAVEGIVGFAEQADAIEDAEAAARYAVRQIVAEHNAALAALTAAEHARAGGRSSAAELRDLTARQRQVSRFDLQADAASELADTYHQWEPLVVAQERQASHRALRDGLALLLIAAVLLALLRGWERIMAQPHLDHKRSRTMLHLVQVTTEVSAGLAGLMVLFGKPPGLLTLVGIFGAGLALAFQDPILSFAGWFALMGRHGIRLGDWVEINGVVGEVVEIRLLRTVLLETGNWITAGHPTGRRVSLPNNFALTGSYFNFSTSGQWMWDELALGVPAGVDARAAAQQVKQTLENELGPEIEQARKEWHPPHGAAAASIEPTVHLRPSGVGLELVVRYPTPARQRAAMRERLWNTIATALAEATAANAG